MCGSGATVGTTSGQTGQILLDDMMGAALVEIASGGSQAGQILFDHCRLLAGHAAGCSAAATAASAGGTTRSGGGMQMATQTGIMPGTVRRHAQRHGARQAQIEGGQLGAGLWPRIEEAGSGGRGGAHDAATVHAQRIVRNNFGGRIGTLGIIAGIHFARSRTVGTGTQWVAQWALRCTHRFQIQFYSCFLAVVVVANIMNFVAKIYLILALHILHRKIHFGFLFFFKLTLIFCNLIFFFFIYFAFFISIYYQHTHACIRLIFIY